MTGQSSQALVLGSMSSRSVSKPSRIKTTITKLSATGLVSSTNSGGMFQIKADQGPFLPGGKDTIGYTGSGFRIVDFFENSTISSYDMVRVMKIEYYASLSNIPKQGVPNCHIYCSQDLDDNQISSFSSFWERENKSLTVLTGTAPTQKICEFTPIRRVSSNVEGSLQIIPKRQEWVDCAYVGANNNMLFGNIKIAVVFPDGQAQYTVSDQGSVLITAKLWCEFKGRIS